MDVLITPLGGRGLHVSTKQIILIRKSNYNTNVTQL